MARKFNAIRIETLESRTLMSMTGAAVCTHADAPVSEPGAQGYKTQQFNPPPFGHEAPPPMHGGFGQGSFPKAQKNQIEMALIRAALALANQLRQGDAPSGGSRAEAPPAPPVPDSQPSAPIPQSTSTPAPRVTAQLIVAPTQTVSDAAILASSSIRQEILSTDFSSKVSAAASFVSSAPAIASMPIFTSAYSASVTAFDNIQSSIAAIAPEVSNIVTNPTVASTIAAVVVPAEKIFNFAEMGTPLLFLGDAIANFAEESASVPTVLASAPTSETAWLITGVVAAIDTAVLFYYYRSRASRRNELSSEADPFSQQLVRQLDSLEDMN